MKLISIHISKTLARVLNPGIYFVSATSAFVSPCQELFEAWSIFTARQWGFVGKMTYHTNH